MASIEFRSGAWRVYWRLGGRSGAKQSVTFPEADEKQALWAKQLVAAHRHTLTRDQVLNLVLGIPLPTPEEVDDSPTVREWATSWLDTRTRITPGVRRTYRTQLATQILPRIGDLRLRQVTGTDVATLLQELGKTRKASTVTRYYAVIHALFAWAVAEGQIPSNPAQRTDFIRDQIEHDDTGEESHTYLTRAQFQMIYENASELARPLLRFLVDSGCRFSEATALDIGDVTLLGKKPSVRIVKGWKKGDDGQWYRGSTKGRNKRTVSIPKAVVDELVPLVANRAADALVFRAREGGPIVYTNFRRRHWLQAVAGASRCPDHPPVTATGKPSRSQLAVSTCDCPTRLHATPTLHDLRHTHAAWMIALGRQIAYISRRLGHHSTTITERVYAGILPEVDDDAMKAYNEAASAAAGAAPAADPDEEPEQPTRRTAPRSSRQPSRRSVRPRR